MWMDWPRCSGPLLLLTELYALLEGHKKQPEQDHWV